MNAANKKTDQTMIFQTGIGTAAYATLDTRTALVETVPAVQVSDGEVIPISEVHELLIKIDDIL